MNMYEPIAGLYDQTVKEIPFDPWGEPVPISSGLPAVEAFVPELLPAPLRDYVFDVADRQQSLPDFVAVAALCGIAAIIGNRIRVAPKQLDDWIEVPNLWGAIIGPPSAMKTPAMHKALGPVHAIQDDMQKHWQEDLKSAKIDDVLGMLKAKEAKKAAENAFKGGDEDGARAILADGANGNDKDKPLCPRIVVNDATVEKLGELLNENPRGLLLVRDELSGFLSQMESEDHASDRAFYLEAFNGSGPFTYDRIGRGTVHIENCTISMIGGVQPSRIAPIVRGAVTGTSNDGLIQRLQLTVWPDPRTSWQWIDRYPDQSAREAYEAVIRDLHELELGSPNNPAIFRLSPQAQRMFQQWMEEIQTEARNGKLPTVLESHVLKMPKTVTSLALIFELVEGGRSEIGTDAMALALGWADYLRSHANRLYSAGSAIVVEDGARLILKRRDMLPDKFTIRDIHRKHWAGLIDREAVGAAVELLEETHHCRKIERQDESARGRPSTSYRWNPKIREAK
ncbi:DUF3987 domain-containing protein [Brucella pseudogrignonensis]|uniref:YfjI family protein n=1 Tax=Brucella pseudogrignonensis TaxID=419475 RepID=UPI001E522EE5|nr:YfjI family protein [Brucella pseudogrignonensis]MCD4512791.1 DUF3987 domain-containing protein [Brucella pseudogrignonensis]